jgi:hypothetical protein
MTVYQSVLAFGDSHVAGCELSADTYLYLTGNVTLEHADAAGKLLAFPQIVRRLKACGSRRESLQ